MNDIITRFTYSELPAPVAAEVEAATARIKDRLTRQVRDIIETGGDLLEVKSKLQHGQFERWLAQEFGMTDRTARRFMQAATWAEGKTDMVSDLTPTAVYLLSARNTPDVVHEQVVERLEKGLPAEPEMIRHLIKDAQIKSQSVQRAKGAREARDARKRRERQPEEIKNRRERQRAIVRAEKQRKRKEQSERLELAANFYCRAGEMAGFLRDEKKLNEAEIGEMFREFGAVYKRLREAIIEDSLGDNVTVIPPQPSESKS